MKNKNKAITCSKNRNSKKIETNSKISNDANNNPCVSEFVKKYEGNSLMELLIIISFTLSKNQDNAFVECVNKDEILDTYELLLSPNKDYFVEGENIKDVETLKKMICYSFYIMCADFGINLSRLENDNALLKGFNNFLLSESPETYNAYCKLSNQFGFTSSGQIIDKDLLTREQHTADSKKDVEESEPLLELDENSATEKPCEHSNSNNFNQIRNQNISDSQFRKEIENEFPFSFQLICAGLGHKIKNEINESHQIDDILSSFSSLMAPKCKYCLDSEGRICYEIIDDESFNESNESGLVIELGIFSCFKINLEFLEYRNSNLKGLNEFLLKSYPETYKAYSTLTNLFGFEGTVDLGLHTPSSSDAIRSFLQNVKVENWNCESPKHEEPMPEEKVSVNFSPESFNEREVVKISSQKRGAKKQSTKRKSSYSKNRRKAKKLFKQNPKQVRDVSLLL